MGQKRPKFDVLYTKKYTSLKKYTTVGCAVATNMSYVHHNYETFWIKLHFREK